MFLLQKQDLLGEEGELVLFLEVVGEVAEVAFAWEGLGEQQVLLVEKWVEEL